MRELNVGQVAAAAGLTVRTLHHWDAVGLLVPSGRTSGGYRSYGPQDLERLRRVLTYRELGFGLEQIARLLDDPAVDALDHLRRQHALLDERIARLQSVAALVRRAVEARSMGIELDPHEIREVFGDEDPSQHAEEARERWGETEAWAQSHARTSSYGKADWLRVRAEADEIERRFAEAMAAGQPADGELARGLAEEHRQSISRNFYDCSLDVHAALAQTYVADDRFAAHYERRAAGLARYVHDAVLADCEVRGRRGS